MEEAGLCLHYCLIQISLRRMRRLSHVLLSWISYKVKEGDEEDVREGTYSVDTVEGQSHSW